MESASVDKALEIIRNVTDTADNVCVNKHQCKLLAERFCDVGKALEASKEHTEDVSLDLASAIAQILTVLKKGESLVKSYKDEKDALYNVLNRANNPEAFKEILDEVDNLGSYLNLDGTEKSEWLSSNADTDRKEIIIRARKLVLDDFPKDSGSMVEEDVENMEKAVTQKCSSVDPDAEDLSYLNIPSTAIHVGEPIKELKPLNERKSQADAHLDGQALVHKGRWNGCNCAIKVFKSADMQWNTEELRKEIASLVKLRHPHVTQLIGCSEDGKNTYVLYEMMDSDLRKFIDDRKKKKILPNFLQDDRPFSRTKEVSIITQIARGMFYLHEQRLVHGELKCSNLLVKGEGDHIDVKVADFHCSRELGKVPTAKFKPAHRARWMPPEQFQYLQSSDVEQPSADLLMKGDVYSFAMTCYEVVTGKYPFDGNKVPNAMIKAGERPKLPQDLNDNLKRLIAKCWHEDPQQRPSFQDICYVLKVDAMNLMSRVEGLFSSCLGLGNQGEAVGDDLEGKEWANLLAGLKMTPNQEIGDAARDLPHYLKIKPSDLKPMRKLDKGSSAEVFAASWIECRFAVKWLKVDHVIKLRQEVSIMMKLLHPHVVRLVGFSVLGNRCAIVMELMENSLRELMNTRIKAAKDPKHATPFSESESLGIITKLALGLEFLHFRDVVHGDLKCANVLVKNANSKGTQLEVKIVDFGLSQLLGESSPEKPSGTVGWWRAPEIIERWDTQSSTAGDKIDYKAADVYSFAMVCYEVLTGNKPFHNMGYDLQKVLARAGGIKLDNINMRPDLKQLLKDCWSLEPAGRPKLADISKRLTRMSG